MVREYMTPLLIMEVRLSGQGERESPFGRNFNGFYPPKRGSNSSKLNLRNVTYNTS
jgi:hypothetical protein